MTRITAPTALEESALLERAKSFAREENFKVNHKTTNRSLFILIIIDSKRS